MFLAQIHVTYKPSILDPQALPLRMQCTGSHLTVLTR